MEVTGWDSTDADHELVEVDGFVFRRKRQAITPMPAPPPEVNEVPAVSPAAIKLGLQFDAGSPAVAGQEAGDNHHDDAATLDQEAAARAPENESAPEHHDEQAGLDAAAAELDMVPATKVMFVCCFVGLEVQSCGLHLQTPISSFLPLSELWAWGCCARLMLL